MKAGPGLWIENVHNALDVTEPTIRSRVGWASFFAHLLFLKQTVMRSISNIFDTNCLAFQRCWGL